MDNDFEDDFGVSLAQTAFTLTAHLTCCITFVYCWMDTGSWFAALIAAVTVGFICGLFLGLLAATTCFLAWLVFVLGRSLYFYCQHRAQITAIRPSNDPYNL